MFRRSHIRFHLGHQLPATDNPDEVILLCQLSQGQRARIVHIEQGRRLRKRLADLGLTVGTVVCVMRASRGAGAMILALHCDTRLAIGHGMASKIYVQRVVGEEGV